MTADCWGWGEGAGGVGLGTATMYSVQCVVLCTYYVLRSTCIVVRTYVFSPYSIVIDVAIQGHSNLLKSCITEGNNVQLPKNT